MSMANTLFTRSVPISRRWGAFVFVMTRTLCKCRGEKSRRRRRTLLFLLSRRIKRRHGIHNHQWHNRQRNLLRYLQLRQLHNHRQAQNYAEGQGRTPSTTTITAPTKTLMEDRPSWDSFVCVSPLLLVHIYISNYVTMFIVRNVHDGDHELA